MAFPSLFSSLPETLPQKVKIEEKDCEVPVGKDVATCIIFATVHFPILQEAYTNHGIFLTSCEVVYFLPSLILGMDIRQNYSQWNESSHSLCYT